MRRSLSDCGRYLHAELGGDMRVRAAAPSLFGESFPDLRRGLSDESALPDDSGDDGVRLSGRSGAVQHQSISSVRRSVPDGTSLQFQCDHGSVLVSGRAGGVRQRDGAGVRRDLPGGLAVPAECGERMQLHSAADSVRERSRSAVRRAVSDEHALPCGLDGNPLRLLRRAASDLRAEHGSAMWRGVSGGSGL